MESKKRRRVCASSVRPRDDRGHPHQLSRAALRFGTAVSICAGPTCQSDLREHAPEPRRHSLAPSVLPDSALRAAFAPTESVCLVWIAVDLAPVEAGPSLSNHRINLAGGNVIETPP